MRKFWPLISGLIPVTYQGSISEGYLTLTGIFGITNISKIDILSVSLENDDGRHFYQILTTKGRFDVQPKSNNFEDFERK